MKSPAGAMLSRLPLVWRQPLRKLIKLADERGLSLYLVGGPARDLLYYRKDLELKDVDVVVEGSKSDVAALGSDLARKLSVKWKQHERFGTVSMEVPEGGGMDLVMARSERYPVQGGLPEVAPADIITDLRRRDFTINSMAFRLNGPQAGELLDPVGGEQDLQEGRIRVLHRSSFVDDPTRLIRAVRFEQRFACALEDETAGFFREAVDGGVIDTLSGSRLAAALAKALEEEKVGQIIDRLEALGLWRSLGLDLPTPEVERAMSRADEARFSVFPATPANLFTLPEKRVPLWRVRFLALISDRRDAFSTNGYERLGITGEHARHIKEAVARWKLLTPRLADPLPATPSQLVSWIEPAGPLAWMLALMRAEDDTTQTRMRDYLDYHRYVTSPFNGDELMEMGIPSGPVIKQVMGELRAAALDRGLTLQQARAELIDLVKEMNRHGHRR